MAISKKLFTKKEGKMVGKRILLEVSTIVAVLFLLLASNAFAANYFVDATNGNDENDGLSPDLPWRTIEKVNHQRFYPGDSIHRRVCRRSRLPGTGGAGSAVCLRPDVLRSVHIYGIALAGHPGPFHSGFFGYLSL